MVPTWLTLCIIIIQTNHDNNWLSSLQTCLTLPKNSYSDLETSFPVFSNNIYVAACNLIIYGVMSWMALCLANSCNNPESFLLIEVCILIKSRDFQLSGNLKYHQAAYLWCTLIKHRWENIENYPRLQLCPTLSGVKLLTDLLRFLQHWSMQNVMLPEHRGYFSATAGLT